MQGGLQKKSFFFGHAGGGRYGAGGIPGIFQHAGDEIPGGGAKSGKMFVPGLQIRRMPLM